MAKIPFGRFARRALGWLVKKGLEAVEEELDRQREHGTGSARDDDESVTRPSHTPVRRGG